MSQLHSGATHRKVACFNREEGEILVCKKHNETKQRDGSAIPKASDQHCHKSLTVSLSVSAYTVLTVLLYVI